MLHKCSQELHDISRSFRNHRSHNGLFSHRRLDMESEPFLTQNRWTFALMWLRDFYTLIKSSLVHSIIFVKSQKASKINDFGDFFVRIITSICQNFWRSWFRVIMWHLNHFQSNRAAAIVVIIKQPSCSLWILVAVSIEFIFFHGILRVVAKIGMRIPP